MFKNVSRWRRRNDPKHDKVVYCKQVCLGVCVQAGLSLESSRSRRGRLGPDPGLWEEVVGSQPWHPWPEDRHPGSGDVSWNTSPQRRNSTATTLGHRSVGIWIHVSILSPATIVPLVTHDPSPHTTWPHIIKSYDTAGLSFKPLVSPTCQASKQEHTVLLIHPYRVYVF